MADIPVSEISHRIGNPLFALETNLWSLGRLVERGHTAPMQLAEILAELQASIAAIKEVLGNFKHRSGR